LEQFIVQPIDVVYPSELYTLRDWATAIKRSVHAYDVVPIIDYASASRIDTVHAYDVLTAYDSAYASRRNVIHAYDVISQLDSVTKSGNVTLSVTDILTIPEWFFRVNKALKLFDYYTPFELAFAFTAPTIFTSDFVTVYDKAELYGVRAITAFDKLITEDPSYTKSYNSLFYSLFQRRIPIRYLTLSVSDNVGISDYAVAKKIIIIPASDYSTIGDSASAKGAITVLVPDYSLLTDLTSFNNRTIAVYDIISVADYGSAIGATALEAKDYATVGDYTNENKVPSVTAFDAVVADSVSTSRSYSPLLFSILGRRIPVNYCTLSILDGTVAIADSASVKKFVIVSVSDYGLVSDGLLPINVAINAYDVVITDVASAISAKAVSVSDYIAASESVSAIVAKMVSALDVLISDSVTTSKSYLPLFYSLFQRRIPIRYMTLSVSDYAATADSAGAVEIKMVSVSDVVAVADYAVVKNIGISASDYVLYDSASAVLIKTVTASDYIIYDSVPSMSPSDIRYISLYANVGMRSISVFDKVVPYESTWVGPRVITVNASDYLVSDSVAMVKRSVHAYDVVGIWENVNIVKL